MQESEPHIILAEHIEEKPLELPVIDMQKDLLIQTKQACESRQSEDLSKCASEPLATSEDANANSKNNIRNFGKGLENITADTKLLNRSKNTSSFQNNSKRASAAIPQNRIIIKKNLFKNYQQFNISSKKGVKVIKMTAFKTPFNQLTNNDYNLKSEEQTEFDFGTELQNMINLENEIDDKI